MPTMFSRRRAGSASKQPLDQSTIYSATTAASQAFLGRAASTTSLSSAAAAAALRSQTTSPEPVGSIQTKRMTRRNSNSSVGSGSVAGSVARGAPARGGLQRNNSGGSMTERTFRTPSPGRATSPAVPPVGVPPVPAIPANMAQGRYRGSSVEAIARVTSPTPQRGRRGASADRSNYTTSPASQQPAALPNVIETSETARQQPSRNFSRPMSPTQDSPTSPVGTASKYKHSAGSWHTGASGQSAAVNGKSRSVSSTSAQAKVDRILQAGQRGAPTLPVNVPARPQSAASTRTLEKIMVYDPNSRTFVERLREPDAAQPPSPTFNSNKPDPGVWDRNTRTFIQRPSRSATSSPVPSTPALVSVRQKPSLTTVDTTPHPPPKNPARFSPTPSSPRLEALVRQPSVVHEDTEGEKTAESSAGPPKSAAATGKTQPKTTSFSTPITGRQERSGSLDVPYLIDANAKARNSSSSPQRTRFSPSPILDATKHVPPPRDISPAKPALKHASPGSSLRTSSPITSFKSPPSEISDTVSDVGSQDGLTASGKKKQKSVRVSFDENTQSIQSDAVRPITPPTEDEEDSAFMRPRPALPSFGSVRKARMQAEPAEKVTEMPPERHEVSSDHIIGGILRNATPTKESNEPLPPEVTSKESAGYASDSSVEDTSHVVAQTNLPQPQDPAVRTSASLEHKDEEPGDVPAITLLPPTPGLDEEAKKPLGHQQPAAAAAGEKPRSSMEIVVPGGWSAEDEQGRSGSTAHVTSNNEISEPAAATSAVSIQTPQEPLTNHTAFAQPQQDLSDIDEHETDDDAEFSDAAEDLSELDNGGFASLDAIVESPVATPVKPAVPREVVAIPEETTPKATVPIPDTSTAATADGQLASDITVASSGDWTQATSYWSRLTSQQREQLEMEHLQPDDETEATPVVAVKQPVKKKSSGNGKSVVPPTVVASTNTPSTQPAMKKTMRNQPAPTSTGELRQSMRTPGAMPKTMRASGGPQPAANTRSAQTMPRPLSSSSLQSSSAGAAMSAVHRRPMSPDISGVGPPASQKKGGRLQRPTSPPVNPQISTRLTKELAAADDSDSESSFRKRRRAGSNTSTLDSQGRYSMKRSMRGGPVEPVPPLPVPAERRPTSPTPSRGKGSLLRSLSPSGSLFGRKKVAEPSVADSGGRTTLRASPAARAGPTLRASAAPAPARSRFKSRFADSDDEDDGAPSGSFFRSRFADSDDDEPGSPAVMRADLRPVRGIPRRQGRNDGDSTDLEDSDDENARRQASRKREKQPRPGVPDPAEVEKAMAAARRNLGLEKQEGDALEKGTLRAEPAAQPTARPPLSPSTPDKKRRSFMGSILRRNRNSSSSVPQVGLTSPVRPSTPSQIGSPPTPSSPIQGKLTRRSSNQPRPIIKSSTNAETAGSVPTTPVASGGDAEHWPLPPPIPDDSPRAPGNDRPNTSDGVSSEAVKLARTMRPNMQPRSASGQPVSSGHRVRIQAGEEGSEPGERQRDLQSSYSQRTGKKKKFGMLRRAFKLDD